MSAARELLIFRVLVMLGSLALMLGFLMIPLMRWEVDPGLSGSYGNGPFNSFTSLQLVGDLFQQDGMPSFLQRIGALALLSYPFLVGLGLFLHNLLTWRRPLVRRWYGVTLGLSVVGIALVGVLFLFILQDQSSDTFPVLPCYLGCYALLVVGSWAVRRKASSSIAPNSRL